MLMRWDPFAELNRVQEQLFGRGLDTDRLMRPPVDIREEDDAFVVHAELPGVKAEEVQVEVEHGVLTIRGERKLVSDEKTQKQYRRVERYYGAFSRSFSLPSEVDANAVQAELKDGVLSVRVPKKAAPEPKRITVKAA